MLFTGRFAVNVIGKTKTFKAFIKLLVIEVTDFLGCFIFLFGSDCDRCTMAVTAGDKKDSVAFGPEVPGKYITR